MTIPSPPSPEKMRPLTVSGPMPGARTALALLLGINIFNFIDRYVLASALPAIERDLFPEGGEFVKTKMGALSTAFMVAYMVLSPVFGWLGDFWRRWALIGLAVIAWSVACAFSGLAIVFGFWFLLVMRCFVGVGEAAYGPVAPTLISDLYPVKQRGWVLAWFYAAIPVGSALGYILGGVVSASPLGWPWAFYLVLPPGVFLGACCFFMPEPRRGLADQAEGPAKLRLKHYGVLLRTPSYVLCSVGMTASTFAIGGIAYWMPYYIIQFRKGGTEGVVDTIFGAILVVAGLTATLFGGWLGDKLRGRFPGSYFLVSGSGMILGFPMLLACMYTPFPLAWVWIFFTIFFLFLNTGPANTILANVTHPAIRATGFALNIFLIHALGDAISPTIIGAIADLSGGDMNAGFLFVSGMFMVSGVLWLAGSRFLERDTDLAPTRLEEPRS